jgi:hypothetical protein
MIRRTLGRLDAWEWGVIFLSVFSLTRGILYTIRADGSKTFVLDRIGTILPLWVFGILWLVAGLWAIGSVLRHGRAKRALLMQCGLFNFWGTFYLITAIGHPEQAISAILFLGLGGLAGIFPRLMAMPKLSRIRGK